MQRRSNPTAPPCLASNKRNCGTSRTSRPTPG